MVHEQCEVNCSILCRVQILVFLQDNFNDVVLPDKMAQDNQTETEGTKMSLSSDTGSIINHVLLVKYEICNQSQYPRLIFSKMIIHTLNLVKRPLNIAISFAASCFMLFWLWSGSSFRWTWIVTDQYSPQRYSTSQMKNFSKKFRKIRVRPLINLRLTKLCKRVRIGMRTSVWRPIEHTLWCIHTCMS